MTDDSTGFDRESGRERRHRIRRQRMRSGALWVVIASIFVAILIFAGRCGIQMAEGDLPESARRTAGYPVGAVVIAGRDGNPIYFADSVKDLRDFYFKYSTAIQRREADTETVNVRRVFGRVELATLKSDADAVQVEVRSGPLADTVYWIHKSQLPEGEN